MDTREQRACLESVVSACLARFASMGGDATSDEHDFNSGDEPTNQGSSNSMHESIKHQLAKKGQLRRISPSECREYEQRIDEAGTAAEALELRKEYHNRLLASSVLSIDDDQAARNATRAPKAGELFGLLDSKSTLRPVFHNGLVPLVYPAPVLISCVDGEVAESGHAYIVDATRLSRVERDAIAHIFGQLRRTGADEARSFLGGRFAIERAHVAGVILTGLPML